MHSVPRFFEDSLIVIELIMTESIGFVIAGFMTSNLNSAVQTRDHNSSPSKRASLLLNRIFVRITI